MPLPQLPSPFPNVDELTQLGSGGDRLENLRTIALVGAWGSALYLPMDLRPTVTAFPEVPEPPAHIRLNGIM